MTSFTILQIILTLFVGSFVAAKIEDSFIGKVCAFLVVSGISYAAYLHLGF